jgi:mannose-6-phosphate isomerase
MERVWGGRRFETLLGKELPRDACIGELWEVVDRPEAQSIVKEGPLRGLSLHDLWTRHRTEVFGSRHAANPSIRFPLLLKLLDARDRLSVQAHPPEHRAGELGGEPKTECWYFLEAGEQASIFAGLRKGVTRREFEQALDRGALEEMLHKVSVRAGESIFIPSGRLHAIGEELVIVEVQQNSDTTYRVFDWNRTGLDGKPRELHRDQSLASINFDDFEPPVTPASDPLVADCPLFHVSRSELPSPVDLALRNDFTIITGVSGECECDGVVVRPGSFVLVPASMPKAVFTPLVHGTSVLLTRLPAA